MGKDERTGVYVISVIGSTIRLLRDNAREAAVSHDGSKIAFSDPHHTSISIMDVDGQQGHPVITAEEGFRVGYPKFSNDGRRLAFYKVKPAADFVQYTLTSCTPEGKDCVAVFKGDDIRDYDWTPDGRIILARTEPPPHSADSNLWQIPIDTANGKAAGEPKRITDWSGFNFTGLNLTADGKRLIFTNDRPQSDAYVGEFEKTGNIKSIERLTLDERVDWPSGWTGDNRAVLFYSDRAGAFNIYRQALDARTPDALVINNEQKWSPQLSPDGQWVLFLSRADGKSPAHMMRTSIAGGAPERLFEVHGAVDFNPIEPGSTEESYPSFHCGTKPGSACVIAERTGEKVVYSTFDPAQDSRKEVFSLKTDVPGLYSWNLSPDGTRLVINRLERDHSTLQVVTIADGRATKIPTNAARLIRPVWAGDESGVYVVSTSSRGGTVLFVKLDGTFHEVYKTPWDTFSFLPSPDGKHAAMGLMTTNANVWQIANFPKN